MPSGVVVGIEPSSIENLNKNYMPGATSGYVLVCVDPNVILEAQADEAVAAQRGIERQHGADHGAGVVLGHVGPGSGRTVGASANNATYRFRRSSGSRSGFDNTPAAAGQQGARHHQQSRVQGRHGHGGNLTLNGVGRSGGVAQGVKNHGSYHEREFCPTCGRESTSTSGMSISSIPSSTPGSSRRRPRPGVRAGRGDGLRAGGAVGRGRGGAVRQRPAGLCQGLHHHRLRFGLHHHPQHGG